MDRFIRLSRLVVAAVAITASTGLVTGCSRPDGPEVYAYECERRGVPASATSTSLADALAQQAVANKAYRRCIDRRGVSAAR